MTPFWILLFSLSIVFINPAFAEPVDVEIDWIIEGQSKSPLVSPEIESEEDMGNVEVEKNKNWYNRRTYHILLIMILKIKINGFKHE